MADPNVSDEYVLRRRTDRWGFNVYDVLVGGVIVGEVVKTTARAAVAWSGINRERYVVCTGSTLREVANTVAHKAPPHSEEAGRG